VVDLDWQVSQPTESGLPLVFAQLPPPNFRGDMTGDGWLGSLG